MAKRKTYDDEFRASAVVMLASQGYPNTPGALTAVANHLKVPLRTLSRWFNKEQNPPPDRLVNIKKGEMVDRLTGLLDKLVDRMMVEADDAPLSQLATTFGIAFDKKQILSGGVTARVEENVTFSDSRERLAQLLDRRAASLGAGRDSGLTH